MKKIPLSSAKDRAFAGALMVVLVSFFAVMLYALRASGTIFAVVACTSVFLVLLFGTYVYSVFAASCLVDPEDRQLTIKGLRSVELDAAGAVCVKIQEYNTGNAVSWRILLLKEDGSMAAAFLTHFTMDKGAGAEAAARKLAELLEMEFVPAPAADARSEKDKAGTVRQNKFSQIKEKFSSGKAEAGAEPTPAPEEENGTAIIEEDVNYDALDDEKL